MIPKSGGPVLALCLSILASCAAEMSGTGDDNSPAIGAGGTTGDGGAAAGRSSPPTAGSTGGVTPAADAGPAGPDARVAASDARPLDPTADARSSDGSGPGTGDVPPAPALGAPIPVLIIDTMGKAIPSNGKGPAAMKVIYDHDGTLKDIALRPVAIATPIGIGLRGNTSAGYPQKSFTIELRDAAGMDRAQSLVGMPSESDWVLHAPWFDKARIRNALSYALARDTSKYYQPRARFVEVMLNGQYNGLYLLVERIKRDKNRVDIPALAADGTGDQTGGYIFRHEAGAQNKPAAERFTIAPVVYVYDYPKADKITPAQKAYLQDYITRFQAMLAAPSWADATQGYPAWVDVQSFIDSVALAELSDCGDCYYKSQYFYKQTRASGDRLFKGPVWDFDFGYQAGTSRPPDQVTLSYEANSWGFPLWKKLNSDPKFWNSFRCRWNELRKGALTSESINAKIDLLVKEIGPAAEARHRQKWPRASSFSVVKVGSDGKPGVSGYDSPLSATWEFDLKFMRDWIAKRLLAMDANLPGKCQ